MELYENMCLPFTLIPTIINQYRLQDLVTANGWVCLESSEGVYGLKQVGILAKICLKTHLAKYGYFPTPRTPHL
jgi:hypothetical protein